MGFLRGLLGGDGAKEPVTVVPRDVSHRVFVEARPDAVWQALVAPAPGAEHGVDCVGLLALPRAEPAGLPEFAGVWRRGDGRLWAGLSTVVDLEPGRRVVARSADGATPFDLATTVEPLDHGTVVTQVLGGLAPDDPLAGFARTWIARGLLGLKADVERRPRDVPEATGAASVSPWDAVASPGSDHLGVPGVPGGSGAAGDDGALVRGGPAFDPRTGSLASAARLAPAMVPVTVSASVEVALAPEHLWTFLVDPESEPLLRPDLERVVRLVLSDAPEDASEVEHVLAVHRRPDGRRAASLSVLVDVVAPVRIVERDLSAPRESDVETRLEPAPGGSRLTETLTAWLPGGFGQAPDTTALASVLQSRLDTARALAEAGVAAPRDPRTGFLPPVAPPEVPPAVGGGAAGAVGAAGEHGTVPGGRPSVPSSVLLPPPHVVAPARPYLPSDAWWGWSDLGVASFDLGWW